MSDWLVANKLSLNLKKSNVILFRQKHHSSSNINKINLFINNEPL